MKLKSGSIASLKNIGNVDLAFELFPAEVIDRYAMDFNLSSDGAKAHAYELVRYLMMCADKPYANYGMSGQIDEIWHTFILFTRLYAEWCEQVFGSFVHHTPTPPQLKEQVLAGQKENTYTNFYRDYSLFYGGNVPAIWPTPHIIVNDCGGGGCGGGGCSSGCSGGGDAPSSCSTPAVIPATSCGSSSPSRPSPSKPRDGDKKRRWPWQK